MITLQKKSVLHGICCDCHINYRIIGFQVLAQLSLVGHGGCG